MTPKNLCRSCDQDFSSVEAFDRHRVGTHSYTYSEGLKMPPLEDGSLREDGRRCLSIAEMEDLGWRKNERGLWFDPARASRAARAFAPSSED